jgi:hypothetical protein
MMASGGESMMIKGKRKMSFSVKTVTSEAESDQP